MSDIESCAEPQKQADEWGTVAGGLPPQGSPTEWTNELLGSGTLPNGGRHPAPASLQVPPELTSHPRYRIVQVLGKGGMGAVYHAEHRVMKRAVALKVIAPQLVSQPEAVERFRREVEAAARLSHPNIVTAYDAEQAGGCHFLVMELVDGVSLNRIVEQHGPFTVEQACEYARQAALGLEHARTHGMVHRDIKPHNLMLTRTGQVKILDFGLTRFADDNTCEAPLTHWSCLTGTPDYIAPEQAVNAHQADIRADIYGLGCTLYYLLTGRPPFPLGGAFEKVAAHLKEEPTPLTDLRRDLPADLVSIIQRMMAKDRERRFQTPAEVARALASVPPTAAAPVLQPGSEPLVPGEQTDSGQYIGTPDPALAGQTFDLFLPSSPGTEGAPSRTNPYAPAADSRTLPMSAQAGAAVLGDPARQDPSGNPASFSSQPIAVSEPGRSRFTVGLLVLVGFGVGGAFGLLNLFRPATTHGTSDRATAAVRSKAPEHAPEGAKSLDPDRSEPQDGHGRDLMIVPNLDPVENPKLAATASPNEPKSADPNKTASTPAKRPAGSAQEKEKWVLQTKGGNTTPKPVPTGRGQVVVRSRDQNLEVAIKRRGFLIITLRPSMGLKEIPAGEYDAVVVGGPLPLQGFTTRLTVARGGRVALDVRPEGILVGDAASMPPPPPEQTNGYSQPGPPPGPPRKRPG